MIITTTDYVPERKVKEILGVVKGSTIRARHFGSDIVSSLKSVVGGELKGYSKMIDAARDQAMQRMMEEAKTLNADAVINMRFVTAEVMSGAAEVLAYGTAVKLGK